MANMNGEAAAAAGIINPLLLAVARRGFWEALDFLFQREDAQEPPMMIPSDEFRAVLDKAYRRIGVAPVPPDAELGVDHLPALPAAGALLQGVTPSGDTALHVVARSGDGQDFLKCASIICGRDRGLLFARNRNAGQRKTPLHCADQAENSRMVSHLIDLAGREAPAGDINPLLLLSARVGSWKALKLLLRRADAKDTPMIIPTEEFLGCLGGTQDPAEPDEEQGGGNQPASLAARELLKGVTPDGDTALHAVASSGDGEDFKKCAIMICGRDWDLLFTKNHNGDTPMHCAARAGKSKMVSCLMALARPEGDSRPDGKLTLLRMQNKRHETALHEAIRIDDGRILGPKDRKALFQDDHSTAEKIRSFVDQQKGMIIVKKLMVADHKLARYPTDGISPLYLAILLQKSTIAVTLYHESCRNLSYSGADGQNALHLALRRNRDKVMIELLLDWEKKLTSQVDKDGSTPLHFALTMSSSRRRFETHRTFPWCRFVRFRPTQEVCQANPAALYQAEKDGLFPIHVAATIGAGDVIRFILHKYPDNAGLRDAKGKTFLHIAAEKGRLDIVSYVCGNPSLDWIVNMQDNDGNTALHLAIQSVSFDVFCALFGHPKVNLHLTNNQWETPRDLSISRIPHGMDYYVNSENLIYNALRSVGASSGALRWDKAMEKYRPRPKPEEVEKESERLKDATQKFTVASVLIATMAFGATFAIPGGYRADEHTNAGTPTLAGGYVFDAFVMATALAFICSSVATVGFMFAGVTMVSLTTRSINFQVSVFFISSSVTSMFAAFALGVYMVLAPVARETALVVCVISPAVLVFRDIPPIIKVGRLLQPLLIREGLFLGTRQLLCSVMSTMLGALWPFLVTFGWAAVANIQWRQIQSVQVESVLVWSLGVIFFSCIIIFAAAMFVRFQWRRFFSRVIKWYRSI